MRILYRFQMKHSSILMDLSLSKIGEFGEQDNLYACVPESLFSLKVTVGAVVSCN